jgi:diaminopimelate decarboxylase
MTFLLGTQRINARGILEIGGCDTIELAARFGTPLYVFDEETIRARCRAYRAAFQSRYQTVQMEYAGKAFLCAAMARLIQEEGLHLDVASGGELYTALKAGFPPSGLVFHGNYKSAAELQMALDAGVGRVVVDNFDEIGLLGQLTERRSGVQQVLVRAAPGVDPQTHRRIRTGQADTKFGLNIASGAALEGVRRVLATRGLLFTGLHAHVGSNLHDAEAHLEALQAVLDLAVTIREETGLTIEEMNLGGGLGIRYVPSDEVQPLEDFAEQLTRALYDGLASRHLPLPALQLEPGRSIVGEAGTTLYTVGPIKEVPIPEPPGSRTYVAIDGGMSDNPRPQLYDAAYHALVANKADRLPDAEVRVAGKHCETDILIPVLRLPRPEPGDVLAVQSTGAYTYSMASNYNRLPRPAAVFVRDGKARLVIRRETLDDLVRQDVLADD